jgi:hypothetical protein
MVGTASGDDENRFGAVDAVRHARRLVRTVLRACGGLAGSSRAEIVAGELVRNACAHAVGPYRLTLICDGHVLRIEVVDCSPERAPHDRGLGWAIVSELSARRGIDVRRTEKRVWSEVPVAHHGS